MHRYGLLFWTIVGLALSVFVIIHTGIMNIVSAFLQAQFYYLIPYLFISFLIVCTLVLRLKIILLSQKHDVAFNKLFLVHCSAFSVGFLSPFPMVGGEGAKAYLLTKENVRFEEAFSSIIIDRTIQETMNFIFAAIGIIAIILFIALPRNTILSIILIVLVFGMILGVFYYRIMKGKSTFSALFLVTKKFHKRFYLRHVQKILDTEKKITSFYKKHTFTFVLVLILSFISWVFMFLEYKLLLLTFGYNASLLILFLVIAVVALAYMAPIPTALGALEGGQASLFQRTNMDVGDAVGLSLIIRSRDLIITFIGLLYMLNFGILFSKKKNLITKKDIKKWKN